MQLAKGAHEFIEVSITFDENCLPIENFHVVLMHDMLI